MVTSMNSMTKPKRSRLSPENRRMQLLDCAKNIILKQGFSALTMEAVTKEANVSNPLVYKYFDTRLSLLTELTEREIIRYYSEVLEELEVNQGFQHLLHISVRTNFDEVANGNILSILRSQPDIERRIDKAKLRKKIDVGPILVRRTMDAFQISKSQAINIVTFGSGVSQRAAMQWQQHGGDRDKMIKEVIAFINGGIDALISNR
ncbi:MAG: TetR/AcrR family transcriptional regulator [Parasphingorhabdus sp.]